MKRKECILYDRPCTECGECLRCDLDPDKICDNCGQCLNESGDDFASILITAMENPEDGQMHPLRPTDKNQVPEIHRHEEDCDCGEEHHHGHDGLSENLSHPDRK